MAEGYRSGKEKTYENRRSMDGWHREEVDALKQAHDAVSGYIDAKFIQKVRCPA
jgi:hypothetical protein